MKERFAVIYFFSFSGKWFSAKTLYFKTEREARETYNNDKFDTNYSGIKLVYAMTHEELKRTIAKIKEDRRNPEFIKQMTAY